jgi:hypothetical protein
LTRGHRVKVVVQSHAKDEVDKIGPDLLQRLMTMVITTFLLSVLLCRD